jgi:hypothetical protein
MAFVIIFLQELIQGKGVFDGIREGDAINIALLAVTGVTVLGFTAFLALKGPDDYVKKGMNSK